MSLSGSTERQQELHRQIIVRLGGCCVGCGMADMRVLQIDHVRGGGSADLRDQGGGLKRYYRILKISKLYDWAKLPLPFQLLCANCNWIKRHEEGEARGMAQHRKKSKMGKQEIV
jgi:hypothetical protein